MPQANVSGDGKSLRIDAPPADRTTTTVVTTPLSETILQGRVKFVEASPWVTLLLVLMLLDILSGVARALIQRALNSTTSYKGLVKKCAVLIAVAMCAAFGPFLPSINLTLIIAIAFCANEAISILENLGQAGVWLPPQLMQFFSRLREQANGSFEVRPPDGEHALSSLARDVVETPDEPEPASTQA